MSDIPSVFSALDPVFVSQAWALTQVILIDLVMAGDNAIAVGLAAAGLPPAQRRKAILYGLVGAVVLRIIFVLLTVQLLKIVGLLLAGGILLLWVCWKMWKELQHDQAEQQEAKARAEAGIEDATGIDMNASNQMGGAAATPAKQKTLQSAVLLILFADVSMSLDNVLAVSGAASEHVEILVFGLLLSIALMGVASHLIANLLHKHRWIGYVGLLIIFYVALRMMWEGGHQVLESTHCKLDQECLTRAQKWIASVPDMLKKH